jgi:hypothetical protein
MLATDFIEAVRITGGLAGLELRGVEAHAGLARLTIVNPTAASIDRAATDFALSFSRQVSGA